MILNNVNGDIANVAMSKAEALVFHDALTIAKVSIGEDLLVGEAGRANGINVEHLRTVLTGIIGDSEWKKSDD